MINGRENGVGKMGAQERNTSQVFLLFCVARAMPKLRTQRYLRPQTYFVFYPLFCQPSLERKEERPNQRYKCLRLALPSSSKPSSINHVIIQWDFFLFVVISFSFFLKHQLPIGPSHTRRGNNHVIITIRHAARQSPQCDQRPAQHFGGTRNNFRAIVRHTFITIRDTGQAGYREALPAGAHDRIRRQHTRFQ